MTAHFRVRQCFELSSRGPVLTGAIVEGEVRSGMQLAVPGWAKPLVIAAVEFVDWRAGGADASVGLLFRDAPGLAELQGACPPGKELRISDPAPEQAGNDGRLRRFWFPLERGFGIGVTAFTEAEARALAEAARAHYHPGAEFLGVVCDVDVRTLDAGHVLPNIGPVAVHGVWYPRLNL